MRFGVPPFPLICLATFAGCSSAHAVDDATPPGEDAGKVGSVGSGPGDHTGVLGGATDGGKAEAGGFDAGLEDTELALQITLSPSVSLSSLDWVIAGPQAYSGTVVLGAGSVKFVLGGIHAGQGYTITMTGSDSVGDPCSGTSPPFNVVAGTVSTTSLLITCVQPTDAVAPADVGAPAADAGTDDASVLDVAGDS